VRLGHDWQSRCTMILIGAQSRIGVTAEDRDARGCRYGCQWPRASREVIRTKVGSAAAWVRETAVAAMETADSSSATLPNLQAQQERRAIAEPDSLVASLVRRSYSKARASDAFLS